MHTHSHEHTHFHKHANPSLDPLILKCPSTRQDRSFPLACASIKFTHSLTHNIPPVARLDGRSVGQSVSQSVGRSVGWSVGRSVGLLYAHTHRIREVELPHSWGPAISHQSAIRVSPASSHQPAVTSQQSPVSNHQSAETSQQSPASNHQSAHCVDGRIVKASLERGHLYMPKNKKVHAACIV